MVNALTKTFEIIKFFGFILSYFLICPILTTVVSLLQCSLVKTHEYWALVGCKVLKVNFKKMSDSLPINRSSKTMILVNHRSWSDFFTHDIVTEHTANFVSRLAVALVSPSIFVLSFISRSIWFFKRGGKKSGLEQLFLWFDGKWESAIRQNMVMYPEGHRMYGAQKPAPLKKGMIGYAYRRKTDIQIAITFGNEDIMNEKKFQLKQNKEVLYYVSEIIKAQDFESEKEHFEYIENKFGEYFEKVRLEFNKSK